MDAVLRNIWVGMCCCCRLPANKIQTANTGGSIQRLLKTNIITLHSSLQVPVNFRVRKKVFIYLFFYIYLKRIGLKSLNLSTNLPMFVYTFQAMWRHRPLKEYSVFVGIRAASTFLSLYTLTPNYIQISKLHPTASDERRSSPLSRSRQGANSRKISHGNKKLPQNK